MSKKSPLIGQLNINLIPTDDLIASAKAQGVKFGFGDPKNRLRYFIKLGLLPKQIRKFENGNYVAYIPQDALGKLIRIQELTRAGYRVSSLTSDLLEEVKNISVPEQELADIQTQDVILQREPQDYLTPLPLGIVKYALRLCPPEIDIVSSIFNEEVTILNGLDYQEVMPTDSYEYVAVAAGNVEGLSEGDVSHEKKSKKSLVLGSLLMAYILGVWGFIGGSSLLYMVDSSHEGSYSGLSDTLMTYVVPRDFDSIPAVLGGQDVIEDVNKYDNYDGDNTRVNEDVLIEEAIAYSSSIEQIDSPNDDYQYWWIKVDGYKFGRVTDGDSVNFIPGRDIDLSFLSDDSIRFSLEEDLNDIKSIRFKNNAILAIDDEGLMINTDNFSVSTDSSIYIASGQDLHIGGIGLNDIGLSSNASGASLVGTFDEFAYSSSTNVQDVLDDFDATMASIVSGGSGVWTLDGTQLYATDTNYNVGIGTTDPQYKLDVSGSLNATTFYLSGSQITSMATELNILDGATVSTSELNYLDGTTITAGGLIYANGSYLANTGAGSSGQLLLSAGAGTPTWSNISALFTAGNDIDITGSTTLQIDIEDGLDVSAIRASTISGLALYDDGVNLGLFVQDGGNVGVGNNNPSSLLSVGSTSQFQVNSSGSIAAATGITSSGTIAFSGLGTGTDDTVVILNGSNQLTTDEIDSRVWGSTLLDDTDIGVNIQAYDAQLTDVAGLTPSDGLFIVGDGVNFVGESGNTARTSLGLGTGDAPTFTGLTLSGLTASSGVYTDGSKNLTSTPPTSGTIGYWSRTGTTLSQANANDNLSLGSGTITTTGTITSGLINGQTISSTANFTGTATFGGLITGNAGLTITGAAANINASGTSATNIGNSTGVLTLASGGASGWTNTVGDLTLSTATSGSINLTSAAPSGGTTTSAFNIKTSTNLGSSDEVLQIGDSAADFLTVLGNGNIGIGTTNPATLLQISSTSPVFRIENSGTSLSYESVIGELQFYGNDSDAPGPGAGASIKGIVVSGGGSEGTRHALSFYTGASTSSTERMRINSAGQIGIGTTSINARLHSLATTEQLRLGYDASNYSSFTVDSGGDLAIAPSGSDLSITGNLRLSGAFYDSSVSAGSSGNILTSTGTGTAWISVSTALDESYFKQNGNSFSALATLGTNDSYGLAFETGGTERVRIDTSGYVGIGTTDPDTKLDISVGSNLTSATAVQTFSGTFNSLSLGESNNPFTSTIGTGISHNDNGITDIYAGLQFSNPSTTMAGSGTNTYPTYTFVGSSASNNINFWDGNVGLGITSPTAKLQVAGNIYPSANDTHNLGSDSLRWADAYLGGETLHIGASTTDEGTISYNTTSNIFNFGTDSTTNADIAFFTDDLYLDKSTGRVGIGTTAPATALDVVGAGIVRPSSDNTGLSIYESDGGNVAVDLQANTTRGLIAINEGSTRTINLNGSTSGSTYFNAGNVGIGTTAPAQKLQVVGGNILLDNNQFFQGKDSGGTTRNLLGLLTTSALQLGGSGIGDMRLSVGSVDPAVVVKATTGNVGIGTTAPSSLLSVGSTSQFQVNSSGAIAAATGITSSGTINFSGLTASSGVYTDGSSNLTSTPPTSGTVGYWGRSGTTLSPATSGDAITTSGNISTTSSGTITSAGLLTGSAGLTITGGAANINASGTNLTNIGNSTGVLTLASGGASSWTNTSGNLTLATATSGNVILQPSSGSVGIGTTNPADVLTVVPTASSGIVVRESDNGNNAVKLEASATNGVIRVYSGGTETIRLNSASASYINTGANLGIGTTNPGGKLDIGSNATLTGNLFALYNQGSDVFKVSTSKVTAAVPVEFTSAGDVSFAYDAVFTNPTAANVIFNNPGYIKTSSPYGNYDLTLSAANSGVVRIADNLTVTNTTAQMALQYDASNYSTFTVGSTGGLTIAQTGTGGAINLTPSLASGGTTSSAFNLKTSTDLGSADEVLQIGDSGADFLTVLGNGNVGIGTTNPSQLLDVVGNIKAQRFQSDTTYIETVSGTYTATKPVYVFNETRGIGYNSADDAVFLALNDAVPAVFDNGGDVLLGGTTANSAAVVNIKSTGLVGIGTTAPANKLHIEGSESTVLSNAVNETLLRIRNTNFDESTIGSGYFGHSSGGLTLIGNTRNDIAGGISFYTKSTTVQERMRITQAGLVGIGTTVPGTRLEVKSSGTSTDVFRMTNSSGTAVFEVTEGNDGRAYVDMMNSAGTVTNRFDTNGDSYFNGGNVGIGVTNPGGRVDIFSSSNTTANLIVTNNTATTIGNGANTLGVLDLQSTSLTTGNFMNIELNALSTGKGINLTSTSTALTSGNLFFNGYWNPGSAATATGDLFKLNVGANATVTGNLFALYNNGSSLFEVGTSKITSSVPHEFTAAGDASFAYNAVFTNQTSSSISSYGPLTITSGESFENLDLTLKAYGTGSIVVDNSDVELYTSQKLILDTNDSGDSYFAHSNSGNYVSAYADGVEVVRFNSDQTVDGNSTFDASAFDVAEYYPTTDETIEAGDIVALANAEGSEIASSYLIAKADPTDNAGQVLGIVSTKPGFSMGGGSFRSEFCSLVLSGEEGESKARKDEFVKAVKDSLLKGEFEIEYLKDVNLELDVNKSLIEVEILALYDLYVDGEETGVPQTRLDTIEDKVNTCKAEKQVPIALAGRVPVKVDANNGDIKAGDLLAPSSFSVGKAMKATSEGWVVGRALEDYSEDKDTIMAYVFVSWYNGESDSATIENSTDILSLDANLKSLLTVTTGTTGRKQLGVLGDINATGSLTASNITTTQSANIGLLRLSATDNSVNALGNKLYVQNEYGALDVDFFNGKLVIGTDGSLVSLGTIQAKEIAAEEFKVLGSSTLYSSSTVGEGTIEIGKTELVVENIYVKVNSKVFITPTTNTDGRTIVVSEKEDGRFKVIIDKVYDKEIKFDYWIVQVE